VRSLADGSLIGTLPAPSATLSLDGSYLWAATGSSLSAWSLTGTPLFSHPGNYANGTPVNLTTTVALPTEIRVALGPAGNDVIEYFAVPSGAESTKSFTGTFSTFALDGAQFFTTQPLNEASADVTVRIYDGDGSLLRSDVLTGNRLIQGMGGFFWSDASLAIGSDPAFVTGIPTGSLVPNIAAHTVTSGSTVARFSTVVQTTRLTLPLGVTQVSAGPTSWAGSGDFGIAYSGALSRYLGCGTAVALAAASSGPIAVSTASARTLVVDPSSGALLEDRPGLVDGLALTADGGLLATHTTFVSAGNPFKPVEGTVQELPDDLQVDGVPQDVDAMPMAAMPTVTVTGFSLASSGNAVGWANNQGPPCTRFVVALPNNGAAPIYSDTQCSTTPFVSPSGTYFAVTDVPRSPTSTTFIFQGTSLLTSVAGVAKGWLDDGSLLVQTYVPMVAGNPSSAPVYSGTTTIFDPQGNTLFSPASLPELGAFTPVASHRIFVPDFEQIYDWTTGAVVIVAPATGPSPTAISSSAFVCATAAYPWGISLVPY
jgi:hypothetical protein